MKKILLISVEADLDLIIELGQKLKEDGHEVDILIGDRWNLFCRKELVRNKLLSNGYDDFSVDIFEKIYLELEYYVDNKIDPQVDWRALEKFDEDHNDGYRLNQVLRSDFMVCNDFHECELYPFIGGNNLKYKFLELHIKKLSDLLTINNYQIFFSISTQTIVKPIVYKIAKKNNIPFLTFEENRIESKWQIFSNFCRGTDNLVQREIEELSNSGDPCIEANEIIKNFRNRRDALYKRFNNVINESKKGHGFLYLFDRIFWTLKHNIYIFYIYLRFEKEKKFLRFGMPSLISTIKFYINNFLNISWYLKNKELNISPSNLKKYIYFPLHLMPESNTVSQSSELDEYACINNLAQRIPPNWCIAVKLPPTMFSISGYTKSRFFFTRLLKIPSVRIVSPWASSYDLINRSEAVACLAGTALLEAAILGKKGIYWGKPEFEVLNNLIHFNRFTLEWVYEPITSNVLLYLQAVNNLSINFDRDYVINGLKKTDKSVDIFTKYVSKFISDNYGEGICEDI